MKSLLNALQEGRLIELPDNDKTEALELLATLIEAIPDLDLEEGITEAVLAREQAHNTGIGKGWGCPHARSAKDGELLCSVGWTPTGIDYGSPDGQPVHLIVMYFVPDTQKNAYLKEISTLAKAIQSQPSLQNLQELTDLGEVRHRLLDAISIALESTGPEARARMIKLEARQAAVSDHATEIAGVSPRNFIPISIVAVPGTRPVVLSLDRDLVDALEKDEHLVGRLAHSGHSDHAGIRVVVRQSSNFQLDRVVYECLAFKG